MLDKQFETLTEASLVRHSTDVSRSNLKYDGRSGLSDFLECLEEQRVARGMTKAKLFAAVPELLKDEALTWFRAHRQTIWDYDSFVRELASAFRPCKYEFHLWDEIRNRRQGDMERVVVYTSAMEGLFRGLPAAVQPDERLRWVKRNLLPYYQQLLIGRSVETMTDLEKLCREAEKVRFRMGEFRSQLCKPGRVCEPDLAYSAPRPKPRSVVLDARHGSKREDTLGLSPAETWNPEDQSNARRSERRCYNCNEVGHFANRCPQQLGSPARGRRATLTVFRPN